MGNMTYVWEKEHGTYGFFNGKIIGKHLAEDKHHHSLRGGDGKIDSTYCVHGFPLPMTLGSG